MQSLKDIQKQAETTVRTYKTKEQEAINIVKICWLVFCDKYNELQLIEGCANLSDLPAVKTDKFEILKIVDGFGIAE